MLSTGGGSHTKQTGEDDDRYRKVFVKEKPNMVIVYGDVNSCIVVVVHQSYIWIMI